ncbi:MAG TPA: hypothetical protein VGJ07_23350 [Rugosimonospora sp.]
MARTPPAAVVAAARQHGLRLYHGRYAQRLTFIACLIEGLFAALLLLSVVVTVMTTGSDTSGPAPSGGTRPGVPWGTMAILAVLGIVLVVHLTLMARHRVYYVFSEGLISTNVVGRPAVSGRWENLSIQQGIQRMYVNGRYNRTLVHYQVTGGARGRLRITLRRGSETDVLLEALLATAGNRHATR